MSPYRKLFYIINQLNYIYYNGKRKFGALKDFGKGFPVNPRGSSKGPKVHSVSKQFSGFVFLIKVVPLDGVIID